MEATNIFFGIDDYMARFVPYIKRYEARILAQGYVVGLMMDGERKSVEPLSVNIYTGIPLYPPDLSVSTHISLPAKRRSLHRITVCSVPEYL